MTMMMRKSFGMRIATMALSAAVMGVGPMWAQDTPTQQDVPMQGPPSDHGPEGRGPGGRGGPDRMVERMTKELSLTPEQVTSVKAIEMDSRKQSMALREDTSTPQEQKHDKMTAIRTASEAKVRAVLTDEQKVKFDAMEARMRERMQNRGPRDGGPDGPPPAQ